MKIQNTDALAQTPLRRDALRILESGLEAVDTTVAIQKAIHLDDDMLIVGDVTYPLASLGRLFVVGAGKCAGAAALALETMLGEIITGGYVIDVDSATPPALKKITYVAGTHPLPSDKNVDATKRMLASLEGMTPNDLVLVIVSGGGSTLLCAPMGAMTCTDEAQIFQELTAHGAPIADINIVRKHLSSARGGGVARAAYPAQVVGLIFSDVPGNDIGLISSGPTARDTSTVKDAEAVFERYGIPLASATVFSETPKDGMYFANVQNVFVASNTIALSAMKNTADDLGYAVDIVDDHIEGEARDVARRVLSLLETKPAKSALLFGGETTVTGADGTGMGGRNQETALAGASKIGEGMLLLSAASDGHDNTAVAGGLCDTLLLEHAREKGIDPSDYLAHHDSFHFFEQTGDAIVSGPTGSNVADLIIALRE